MITVGFICGRGGVSTSVVSAHCDGEGCRAVVHCFGPAQYRDAAAIGWRRDGDRALCPEHSGAGLQLSIEDVTS